MNSHLVTIEVSVERMTYERMELECLTLDKNRFECLDTETVKRRSSVKHDRVLFHDFIEDSPYLRCFLLDKELCSLDVLSNLLLLKLAHDEWLEKLESHLRRNTALVHSQFRPYDDYGTAGIVNTLTEKVLSESSLLALENI